VNQTKIKPGSIIWNKLDSILLPEAVAVELMKALVERSTFCAVEPFGGDLFEVMFKPEHSDFVKAFIRNGTTIRIEAAP
jgi:hypothetical protein